MLGSSMSMGGTAAFGRGVTLTVAASDASVKSKAQADYVCDGTADEVQVIAAIAALPANGGVVQLTEGIFDVAGALASNIKLRSNVTLQGVGWSTIINVSSGGNEAVRIGDTAADAPVTMLNIIVRNFKITDSGGATSNGIGIGITTDTSGNSIFRNILIEYIWADGIDKDAVAAHGIAANVAEMSNFTYSHITSTNSNRTGISTHIATGAAYTIAKDLYIIDCYIDSPAGDGIDVWGSWTNVNLINNTVISPGGHGIHVSDANTLAINDVTIKGNKIYGVSAANKNVLYVIGFANVTLSDNQVYGSRHGIRLAKGALASASIATVTGNIVKITGAAMYAFYVEASVLNMSITGNYLEADDGYALYLSANCTGIASGNVLSSGTGYNHIRTNAAIVIADGNLTIGSGSVVQQTANGQLLNNAHWDGSNFKGYQNTGTATVTTGNTTIVVTHGLIAAPTRVIVSPTNNPTAAVTYWWVDTITATQFTIHVNADPGATGIIFDWRAAIGVGN